MKERKIIEFLGKNDLSDVEELDYEDGMVVSRFFYDFDEDELSAAKNYASDESGDTEDGEVWKEEFYIPYLNDIAADNVGEIIEEVIEEFELVAQYVSYGVDEEQERNEFIAVFSKEDFDIEEVLDKLDL
ncbi:hypothetical protein [Clostridium sp. ZS2-4]|uniref:hypothetical protein n=1 Tax=Clostridium sp. ZS2-4 TaxID=2987703 RepID=UPI00227BDE2B|nr:hypothetical protein [Clostridium sp. ZS2-4]MCY6356486.1 hypothetical protein [Clostridium sp. ZS2-4]